MTETLEDQVNLFDQDIWSGRTCQGPSVQITEKTSGPSLKKRSGLSNRMPMFLNLRGGGGTNLEPSWETDGASLGEYMMPNIGACLREENGFVSWQILTGQQHQIYCLTLNCSEMPRIPNPTKLSQIIEENPNPKYNLSAKACQGILNRARKRGKELPKELEEALMFQASKNEEENQGGGKGILIQNEMTSALSTANNQKVLTYGIEPGAAKRMNPENRISEELSPTLRSNAGDNQAAVAITDENNK